MSIAGGLKVKSQYDVYMCRNSAFKDEIMSYIGKHDMLSHTPYFFNLVNRADVAGYSVTAYLSKDRIIANIELSKKWA